MKFKLQEDTKWVNKNQWELNLLILLDILLVFELLKINGILFYKTALSSDTRHVEDGSVFFVGPKNIFNLVKLII